MPKLTAAEAWCWVAHMLRVESDARYYAYPRTKEDELEGARLADAAEAAHKRAEKNGADTQTWVRAMAKWDGEGE